MKEKQEISKKTKHKRVINIVSIILVIVLSFTCGYFSKYIIDPKVSTSTTDLIRLIEQVGYIIDENGKTKELTKDDYLKAIANGVLDQYSKFYTKEEYEEKTREREGDYSGFGFNLYVGENQEPIAHGIIGNSPADKQGVRAGDKIVSATFNENTTEFINSKQLSDFLSQCKKGDVVEFTIDRAGERLSFAVQKDKYLATYVAYFDNQKRISFRVIDGKMQKVELASEKIEQLGDDTALIRLDGFEGDVASQLAQAIECMKDNNRTKLILDLRNNGGGYMTDFTKVARHLIYNGGKKTLVAYSKGKTENKSYYIENGKNYEFIQKIAVLANEHTASASECLIGAMLYYGEKFSIDNLVVEKNSDGVAKTYGKGIMQTTYKFLDGSAVKLTTAKILWPDKTTCIHNVGILPNPANATEKGISAVIRAVQTLN